MRARFAMFWDRGSLSGGQVGTKPDETRRNPAKPKSVMLKGVDLTELPSSVE